MDINFKMFKSLSNLTYLTYDGTLPNNWEKMVYQNRKKLQFCRLKPMKIINFKLLHECFVNKRHLNIILENENQKFDCKKLEKYFSKEDRKGFPKNNRWIFFTLNNENFYPRSINFFKRVVNSISL